MLGGRGALREHWDRGLWHEAPGTQGPKESEPALTKRLQIPWTQVPN